MNFILSMTGYAVAARETPFGSLNIELRSVNNRFLDVQFRLSEDFCKHESAMREMVASQFQRGKIECRLNFLPLEELKKEQQLNMATLENLMRINNSVLERYPTVTPLSVAEILKWPGIVGNEDLPVDELGAISMELLQKALQDLKTSRNREGEKLKAIVLDRIQQIRQHLVIVRPRVPTLIANFEEKLSTRLKEIIENLEDERIRQEIALFAAKIDIDEELSRLQAHLEEVEHILEKGGAVGKRLDFMMQELNREANTLGAKSVDLEITKISMDLKVIIEQMREQVQNIE